jgi:hypothetical protein
MHRQKGAKTSVDHPFLLLVGKSEQILRAEKRHLKCSSFTLMFVFSEKK